MWRLPEAGPLLADEEAARRGCWSVSTLACKVSTVAASFVMMVARSVVVGSAIVDVTEPVGDDGAVGVACDGVDAVGFSGGLVVEEERLEPDTRLSRASATYMRHLHEYYMAQATVTDNFGFEVIIRSPHVFNYPEEEKFDVEWECLFQLYQKRDLDVQLLTLWTM